MISETFTCSDCGRATTYIGLTERQRNTCEDCFRDSGGYNSETVEVE